MRIAETFYRLIGRRFSTTLATAAFGVFLLGLTINKGGDAIWNSINKGKQWKDSIEAYKYLIMGIAGTFYRLIGRRFSTTLATAAFGVFFLDLTINKGGDAIWDSINKGKQWKEIKPQIVALQKENAALAKKAREEEEASAKAEEEASTDNGDNSTTGNEEEANEEK